MSARCCQMRTGVLFFGFFLGSTELTLWVMFYTFRASLRAVAQYEAPNEEDLIVATVVVFVDLVTNILLICGANKDYSGRRKDLRRWGFMMPWAFMYGLNIVALFVGSLWMFYAMPGGYKSLALIPLFTGAVLVVGYLFVLFFIYEQKQDLAIHLRQQAAAEAQAAGGGSGAQGGPS